MLKHRIIEYMPIIEHMPVIEHIPFIEHIPEWFVSPQFSSHRECT